MKNAVFASALALATAIATAGLADDIAGLVAFDAGENELPEGLAVRGDEIFVGMATAQSVVRIAPDGRETFATYPSLGDGAGFLTGLSFAADGSLWAGLASFNPDIQTGIYRVGANGGQAELFASANGMAFPNDIAWMEDGSALVSDSMAGTIWRVTAEGDTSAWLKHDLLTGDPLVCAPDEVGFGIGANGLDFGPDGALYVAVTDRAQVLRVSVVDGAAGEITALNETDCARLEGIDGILPRETGILAAVNRTDQLAFIGYDGSVSSVSRNEALDFPASIATQGDTIIFTNFGLISASSGSAKPGVLELKYK